MHIRSPDEGYLLDEPSARLHPSDIETLLHALQALRRTGNSLFIIEHEVDVIRRADWMVDVGPGAGDRGGEILYSGPPAGLQAIEASKTRAYLDSMRRSLSRAGLRQPSVWLELSGVTRNNLVEFAVQHPSQKLSADDTEEDPLMLETPVTHGGRIGRGLHSICRVVQVDQKPIGRTPRSNMAKYTGLFDHIRSLFAATTTARERRYDAGRFSFNLTKGRGPTCSGEGFVCVELLFLPSVCSPCPACKGARFNLKALEVKYRGRSIADALALTVDDALEFFSGEDAVERHLSVLSEAGLGYLRLGQTATELSGGGPAHQARHELQRPQKGETLYVLDEPTTGLHPADVERQLNGLLEAGNPVIAVEHDLDIIALSDWGIDMGPGAGEEGSSVVAVCIPTDIAQSKASRTAPNLRALGAA